MRKTWENIGIPKENQGFTGFTQENVDVKPEKNVGLARFHHSDGSFNHQHKEFEEEKNSDMSWGYKENLCFWVDHTQIHLDICVCLKRGYSHSMTCLIIIFPIKIAKIGG